MFNIFKKEETEKENNHPSITAVACLLIHSARIDENYTDKERKIIKDAIIEMGAETENIDKIKNINEEDKKIIIEALWDIIYSDEDADMYETNLMRRLSGLLYLDPKVVGNIKEKVRQKKI